MKFTNLKQSNYFYVFILQNFLPIFKILYPKTILKLFSTNNKTMLLVSIIILNKGGVKMSSGVWLLITQI